MTTKSDNKNDLFAGCFPARFDEQVAEEGVWVEIHDTNHKWHGDFRCALFDKHAPHFKVKVDRLMRLNKKLQNKVMDEAAFTQVFVEVAVLDWKLPNGLPFSKDAALAFFADPRAEYVAVKVIEKASDPLNFLPDPEAVEEPTKN